MTEKFNDMFRLKEDGEKPVNHIAFILDISGSMGPVADDALGNFNSQLKKIREEAIDVETHVTLVMFDNMIDFKFFDVNVNEVKSLDRYPIGGTTALNDAIGMTISKFDRDIPELKDESLDHSALFIIITDGYENSSKEFDKQKIKDYIEKFDKKDNWTFTFLGGDIDVQNVAVRGMSIGSANTMSFNNTSKGYSDTAFTLSASLDSYYDSRKRGMKKVYNFFEETKTPKGELLKDKTPEGEMLKDEIDGELLKPKKLEGKKLWRDDTLNEEEYEEKKLNED